MLGLKLNIVKANKEKDRKKLYNLEYQPMNNYMNMLREARNESKLRLILISNLKKLSQEKLNELAIHILSDSHHFLRQSSNFRFNEYQPELIHYHQSVVWHLADAIHNIPPNLSKLNLIDYIVEYLELVEIINSFEFTKLINVPSDYYNFINVHDEWKYLYKN